MNTKAAIPTLMLAALLLLSCGGSSSDNGNIATPPAAPPAVKSTTPAVQRGQITNSNFDGTWDTFDGPLSLADQARASVDGNPVSGNTLKLGAGEMVSLVGRLVTYMDNSSTFVAEQVDVDHLIDAPVDAVDAAHARLIVRGNTVFVDAASVFALDGVEVNFGTSPPPLTEIKPGDRLLISGYATRGGQVMATRIERSMNTSDYLVTGFVTAVNADQSQFSIGNLIVDYGSAGLGGLSGTVPEVGQKLRVRGSRVLTAPGLRASSLAAVPTKFSAPAGTTAYIAGLVTAVESATAVEVDGYPVASTPNAPCPPPAVNNTVQGTGALAADGSVTGGVVCGYTNGSDLEFTGRVDALDPTFGTLSVLGFQLQPTLTSAMSSTAGIPLDASAVQVGDFVSVDGVNGAPGELALISSLTRLDAAADPSITAPLQELRLAAPLVYLRDLPITLTASTAFTGDFPAGTTLQSFFATPAIWRGDCNTPWNRLVFSLEPDSANSLTAASVALHLDDMCD